MRYQDGARPRGQEDGGKQAGSVRSPLQSQNSVQDCCICLGKLNLPVETNCGHLFCAQCILTHWNHDRHPQPCRCPMCRRNVCKQGLDMRGGGQEVTLLFPSEELTRRDADLCSAVRGYNQQMSESQGGYVSRFQDIPVLIQHLRQDMTRWRGGLPVCSRLYFLMLALALLLYIISPLDLIPEIVFGIFGYADDLIAIVTMVFYITGVYRTYMANLNRDQNE